MFDLIPLPYYTNVYYNVLLFMAMIVLVQSLAMNIRDENVKKSTQFLGYILLVWLILYMGLRPLSGALFGDMTTYAEIFSKTKYMDKPYIQKDYVFNWFLFYCSKIMDVDSFFLLMAALYVIPCYVFARKFSGTYWFFTFFMLVGSFSFWAYGTNGIRNGWATSVFLLALTFYNQKIIMYALMALSFFLHSSLIIPISAFIVGSIYKNPKLFLYGWLAAIPLSLVAGSAFQGIFSGIFSDERAGDYLTKGNINKDTFSSSGFRWDFVLYSASAVFAGYWYIFKKQITDKFYRHLYITYLIANAFWILIIKANFSNRFAYLSWFLMAAVIAYPIFKYKMWDEQYRVTSGILLAYYGFTYIMFIKG